MREAFRLAGLNKKSLQQIVETLDEAGLVSKRGIPLSTTAVWRILTNPFYCGTIRYAGEEAEGIHEKLITPAKFDRAQERLAGWRRN